MFYTNVIIELGEQTECNPECFMLMQMFDLAGRLPDHVVASVGGGSNAIGMFYPFLADVETGAVQLVGVEAGGDGVGSSHSASLTHGTPGVLHGMRSYLLQVTVNGVNTIRDRYPSKNIG